MNNKDIKQVTIDTYNKSARELAEYFRGIGSRVDDIEKALNLNGSDSPVVLEIGCGDGRDAVEIVKRCKKYIGFDISESLIKIARQTVQNDKATFEVADATQYEYGHKQYDVVFAFASLLHMNKSEVREILKKVHESLNQKGVMFISLKRSDHYHEEIKKDRFGVRQFFFYNKEVITEICDQMYDIVDYNKNFTTASNTKWFELALMKR